MQTPAPSGRERLERAVFVTGNPGKLREVQRLSGLAIGSIDVDLPEIQSLDLTEVLLAKGAEAQRVTGQAILVEETGFELASMNGFPGPLVKWMLQAIGPEGLSRTAIESGNPRGVARCRILLIDEWGSVSAEGASEGSLVLPARGSNGFGWDSVFVPDGQAHTFAELADSKKDALSHRGKAWRALRRALEEPTEA